MLLYKLTSRKINAAKPGKYEDGGGLRLVVSKNGAKKWVLRFTFQRKRREMGLGSFPDVSLSEARAQATRYRQQLIKGLDPIKMRHTVLPTTPTFNTCAAKYIKMHRKGWKNKKHARQWVSTLKTYARPVIGFIAVDAITTEHILTILSPLWHTKTETAKRLQSRIENILDYAKAHQYRDDFNPARWRGHLDKLLPKPSRIKIIAHHPAMPYAKVADFMLELRRHSGMSAWALQFLILTATRTSEVLQSSWDEIDRTQAVWCIPAHRMKTKRAHRIPLSKQAMEIIHSIPKMTSSRYLFQGTYLNKPLSNMALLKLMRDIGYGANGEKGHYVPHGFRSSFRDWASEVSLFPHQVAEMALAHAITNKVEAAYRRGDLFMKRREMMQAWGEYVCQGVGPNGMASLIQTKNKLYSQPMKYIEESK